MNPDIQQILNYSRLPARLDGPQVARFLGFAEHDVPVLLQKRLLKCLGNPKKNSPKYFATCTIENLARDPKWLDAATRAISEYWRKKNRNKY